MNDVADAFNRVCDNLAGVILLPALAVPDKPFLVDGAVFHLILEHGHEALCITHIGQLVLHALCFGLIAGDALGNRHHRFIVQRRVEPISVLGAECCNDAFFTDAFAAQRTCQRGQMIIATAFGDLFARSCVCLFLFRGDLGTDLADFLHQPCGHVRCLHIEG